MLINNFGAEIWF